MTIDNAFTRIAARTATAAGKPVAFVSATALVLAWAIAGPLFDYSDTWQLVINTATTVLTFLMVFVIQNSQNRDGRAVQAKLDEILRALPEARDVMRRIEELDEGEIERHRLP